MINIRAAPLKTSGNRRAVVLLSGGIDSPVAAWMAMRSGWHIDMVHFHSYPFSCSNAIQKAKELSALLLPLQGGGRLYLMPFLEIQEELFHNTENRLRIVLYRRAMARIAEMLASSSGASSIITGDSLGQVSSQTLKNIVAVDTAVRMPVLRPLLGFDKVEIINIARQIGTYDISIRPHEDCCTLFAIGRPSTRADLNALIKEEEKVPLEELMKRSVAQTEIIDYGAAQKVTLFDSSAGI